MNRFPEYKQARIDSKEMPLLPYNSSIVIQCATFEMRWNVQNNWSFMDENGYVYGSREKIETVKKMISNMFGNLSFDDLLYIDHLAFYSSSLTKR